MAHPARGSIAIAGDVTVDWTIVAPPGLDSKLQKVYLWEREGSVTVSAIPGGAALIASFLRDLGAKDVHGPAVPPEALADPRFPGIAKTFASWQSFPRTPGGADRSWRLSEFLGWVGATSRTAASVPAPNGAVLVIDDANLGFRDSPGQWPSCLADGEGPDAIVLKMVTPIAGGPLWERLAGRFGKRLTVYLTLEDLRKEDAAIGQALSWERTASEIDAAVRGRADLSVAARTVVGIGLSGAVVVETEGASTLIYDPLALEGDWESAHPGVAYGAGSAITAALAAGLGSFSASTAASDVQFGLCLARRLHVKGLLLPEGGPARIELEPQSLTDESSAFAVGEVRRGSEWSLLGENAGGQYRAIAERVLLHGIQPAAAGVPVETMGAWASVDRAEIESVRSIRNIMREYLGLAVRPRPLSVAVFGPPGSGKSFAIKQMAGQWAATGQRMEVLEFNVSQFSNEQALAASFQRVRDCAVEGTLPLAFWDEFDSSRDGEELGWLASFLAPMQDGAFLEGSVTRPIGPALFVFAGGTHATMEGFKARAGELPRAKATDFLSRLRGYVDILGPNRLGPHDESFVVRRALLLRQILGRKAPQLFGAEGLRIDPGVTNALLSVERYLHGARSMESIVDMSALSGRSRYARSSLPAAHQLSLHVDSGEFLSLLWHRKSAENHAKSAKRSEWSLRPVSRTSWR